MTNAKNCLLLLLLSLVPPSSFADPIYLVTGATGGTGSIIYQRLKSAGYSTRALVTNITKARALLNCSFCDESEGIYVGDVTNVTSLKPAMAGVSFVADAVGAAGGSADAVLEDVEWHGVENQVSALAESANDQGRPLSSLQFSMISSMGTTDIDPKPFMGGDSLFYKMQAECFLASSGIPYTIVKPCGLSDGDAAQVQLNVGHDDWLNTRQAHKKFGFATIMRADVARVIVHSLTSNRAGLRMDICGTTVNGTTPTSDEDLDALFDDATWPWARGS